MKRILFGLILAGLLLCVVAVPVLAAYWAYITVEESNSNSYTNLPVIVSRNVTQLVAYDIITSTGLDTRVLTGDGYPLPHMLANDKIAFVTDLAADEEKQLIFYTGATSLSSFPIIPGYGGYITTPDDPDLELTYVMELLASGYFDALAGANKNILYKQNAFKMNISAANTLRVAALEAGDAEQWELHYSSFTSGEHTVYVVSDGMTAKLYVDTFDVAKDTANLWETGASQMTGTGSIKNLYIGPQEHRTFYAEGRYWCFYQTNDTTIGWRSSTDGASWAVQQTVTASGTDTMETGFSVVHRGDYLHIAYAAQITGDDHIRYRRGEPQSDGSIVWSAAWQDAGTLNTGVSAKWASIAVDDEGYPFICFDGYAISDQYDITKSSTNDGTWTTDSGYPFDLTTQDSIAAIFFDDATDDLYALYETESNGILYGRYYNGTAWASAQTICSTMWCGNFDAVFDEEGNVYIAWYKAIGGPGAYLRVRYADGSFSAITTISTSGVNPTLSYNSAADGVYICYVKAGNAGVYGYAFIGDTLIGEYQFGTVTNYPTYLTSTPYSGHIGIETFNSVADIYHTYLAFPWDWNDNANDWKWMQNNVMPYGEDFIMAIDGETKLEYKPQTIIQGTTLPDVSEATGHDGIITWGTNPAGVAATIGMFHSDVAPGTGGNGTSTPGWTDPLDMMGPTGNPGWTPGLPELATNPFYPAISAFSTLTSIPIGIMWILVATIILFFAMLLAYKYMPHLIMTALVGGGVAAFWVHMGIYPFWVIFIFVAGALAIIIGERQPTIG